jgi:hypothetical protein
MVSRLRKSEPFSSSSLKRSGVRVRRPSDREGGVLRDCLRDPPRNPRALSWQAFPERLMFAVVALRSETSVILDLVIAT